MAFDTTDPYYVELRSRVLQTGARVVPFVGAGLTAYGGPSERLPVWRELIDRLIDEGKTLGLIGQEGDPAIEEPLAAADYIGAMDRILDALGEPTFKRVVERELDDTGKQTPPAVAELVAVGWSLIVTTNLDRLIARAYLERHGRPPHAFTSLDTHRLAAALAGTLTTSETLLAHIHGMLDDYPSWRLTQSHYTQLMQQPGYSEALKQLFLRQVFFVGFGLRDQDLDFMLKTMADIYPAGVGEFYALIPRDHGALPAVRDFIRSKGLRPIFYDVERDPDPGDPFAGHGEAFECLQDLARSWAASGRPLEVTLKYFPELDPYVVGREDEVDRLSSALLNDRGGVVQVVGLGGAGKTSLVQSFLAEKRPELSHAGYAAAFGCSFYRADVGQFVQDLALATVGPLAEPLPQQVDSVCAHLRGHRTVLVLDGFEALAEADGQVGNPYVRRIVTAAVQGRGAVVVTSRIEVHGGELEHAPVIDVAPLAPDEIVRFLDEWGLENLGDAAKHRLIEITAGHPLALRILAGVLRGVPAADALRTIEASAVIDVSDEIDPLRENRLARVLGSYFHHLDETEVAFLTAATVFDQPVGYALLAATLTRRYLDTDVTAPLTGIDLRPVVAKLLGRRLLTVGALGELSSHPTVREYFVRHAKLAEGSLVPLHRYLAGRYVNEAVELPETFAEAEPLLATCRHAAAAEDWTLFDDTFRRRLMHGHIAYLCDYLGAWEEALSIARLTNASSFPAELTREPAYYRLTQARCLKHLGRSSESRAAYLKGLRVVAASRDPECALYLNNFMTLLVWRGELAAADRMAEVNVRALSWIAEEWRLRWQIEHGLSSIAHLKTLQGRFETASVLFDRSERAWDGYRGERHWIWDYYPFYRSETILMTDPTAHDEAIEQIERLMAVAEAQGWPEPACRGHIQAASVHLDRALRERDPAELTLALQRLDKAAGISAGINVPDVAITHCLAGLKAQLTGREIGAGDEIDLEGLSDLIERGQALLTASGMALAAHDLIAARGVVAHLAGDGERAEAAWEHAVGECERQGNALAPRSPRSLVHWLGRYVGREAAIRTYGSSVDLVDMIGAELAPEWMVERLAEVELDDPHAASAGR